MYLLFTEEKYVDKTADNLIKKRTCEHPPPPKRFRALFE